MRKMLCLKFLFLLIFLSPFYVFAQDLIEMEKSNGIYTIPCKVNDLKLDFIFDTGASDVSISLSEAHFMLKNKYLKKSDLKGSTYYQIANGDIVEGTTIIIRELEIGTKKIHDVEASIVHSLSAPLLLGQSALRRFGKFTFDYNNNTLVLGGSNVITKKEAAFDIKPKSSVSTSTYKKKGYPKDNSFMSLTKRKTKVYAEIENRPNGSTGFINQNYFIIKGQKLLVIQKTKDWCQIETIDKAKKGYVRTKDIW
ncbi:clan AA aspartic protease, TIGR02281 family [Pricia antarctica]|uniref:Clan AA aspartic protease, TIGR02281 family n=1 Tax=Pricia antarctica TaxID=641691 RepID=A0A1G7G8E5_9FLAO|nr:retropepsin-like aspartic protease [Pricia antarctica]SDE84367.1 clan AA aspartic protease, TIGR02281 family [Pricia antarctica]